MTNFYKHPPVIVGCSSEKLNAARPRTAAGDAGADTGPPSRRAVQRHTPHPAGGAGAPARYRENTGNRTLRPCYAVACYRHRAGRSERRAVRLSDRSCHRGSPPEKPVSLCCVVVDSEGSASPTARGRPVRLSRFLISPRAVRYPPPYDDYEYPRDFVARDPLNARNSCFRFCRESASYGRTRRNAAA